MEYRKNFENFGSIYNKEIAYIKLILLIYNYIVVEKIYLFSIAVDVKSFLLKIFVFMFSVISFCIL